MRLEDFDNYDQALLWSALKAGRLYAKIVEGPVGHWVSFVSEEDPVDTFDRSEQRYTKVIRVDEIEGLAESATEPSTDRSRPS